MAAWGQLLALVVLLVLAYRPLGDYMAWVYTAPRSLRVERWIYRAAGIDPQVEQRWTTYATSMVVFSAACVVVLYLLQRAQSVLPLNLGLGGVHPAQAFNTAVSFATNTNWQSYSGEQTMGHLVQMSGLTVQNFLSAAVGMAVAIALVRGFIRAGAETLGNFWSDLVRSVIRILLPISFVVALIFVSQGVIQNLHGFHSVQTLAGGTQAIPGGPVASQEAIKELGNNGGGFFNANSAHPFENPNPLTNFIQIFLLLVIPFSLAGTFGKMSGDRKQGRVLVGVMLGLWLASALVAWHYEAQGNSALPPLAGGNMTGKEVRFGLPASALFAASTTGTSTGAVIASHDSFTPFAGAVPLVNMMLSEVTPGGAGAGLYGMLVLAVLSVFIAGLMVGRTPEYLGKKIQAREMKLIALYILLVPSVVLVLTGVALVLPSARSSILNSGPHGLTEALYAFTSGSNNNGSAFGGLNANTDFFNTSLGVAMVLGRYALMVLALGLAGAVVKKKHVPESLGTFPTATPLFGGLLTGVILIVTALTYFPVLSLGPLAEGLLKR
jgi:potassium-transporting ATPase potassium-binding subunit